MLTLSVTSTIVKIIFMGKVIARQYIFELIARQMCSCLIWNEWHNFLWRIIHPKVERAFSTVTKASIITRFLTLGYQNVQRKVAANNISHFTLQFGVPDKLLGYQGFSYESELFQEQSYYWNKKVTNNILKP